MSQETTSLFKRSVCEGLGTGLLVAAVVGSGIMGERLAGGNTAIALLANTIATGAALAALIVTFGSFSGAHFNPIVSLAMALRGVMPWPEVPFYLAAQFSGGLLGTILAHFMFEHPWYSISVHERSGLPQLLSEFVATFGLLCVIWGSMKVRSGLATPVAVSSYIVAAYWFTASTSFANPAVTVARSVTNTFSGIRPGDVPGFVLAQIVRSTGRHASILVVRRGAIICCSRRKPLADWDHIGKRFLRCVFFSLLVVDLTTMPV